MSRVVYKYMIVKGYNEIPLPVGSKFLRFDFQEDVPTVWFEVILGATQIMRKFTIFATGEAIQRPDLDYRGTAFQGPLVWHLYELVPS